MEGMARSVRVYGPMVLALGEFRSVAHSWTLCTWFRYLSGTRCSLFARSRQWNWRATVSCPQRYFPSSLSLTI